jgi:hypothetical protein
MSRHDLKPCGAPRQFDNDESVGRSPFTRPPSKNNVNRTARAWKRRERRKAREEAFDGWGMDSA